MGYKKENWKDQEEDKRVDCWKAHCASVPPYVHSQNRTYISESKLDILIQFETVSSAESEMKVKLKTLEVYF